MRIGIYLPAKDGSKPRSYLYNPGIIENPEGIVAGIRKQFPTADTTENVDFKEFSIINDRIFYREAPLELDMYFWYSHLDISKDSYHLHVLKCLAGHCKVIKNPFSEEIGLDKLLAHSLLRKKGLPVADFTLLSSSNLNAARHILKEWGRMVVKPRLGNYGVGVMLINDYATLRDLFGLLMERSGKEETSLFAERYYEHDPTQWVSTTLFSHKVIYGYRKKEHKWVDGWKVLDSSKVQGDPSSVDYIKPPQEVTDIASRASRAMGSDVIGFDFIKTREGYKIIDENTKPGFYGHCFAQASVPIEKAFLSLLKN